MDDEYDEILTDGNMSDDISEFGLTFAPLPMGNSGKSIVYNKLINDPRIR